jgi:two-component system response regulator YesN
MVKVFLVEDEYVVREGIKNMNWEEYDLEFCGEASDGELAFPLIKKERPDIVITDIRMPFMDGLELSRLIKKELPQTRIIILSGHEEFEYAKSAIQIGVEEYLLKPIDSEQLLRAVKKVADKIEEERTQIDPFPSDSAEGAERLEMAKRELFGALIAGEASMTELLEKGKELELELTASCYQILLLKIQRGHGDDYSRRIVEIMERIYAYTSGHRDHIICFDRAPEGKIFLFVEEDSERLHRQMDGMMVFFLTMMKEYEGVTYFGGIGSEVYRLRELSRAYETACHAFAYRFLIDDSMVVVYEDIKNHMTSGRHAGGEYGMGEINFANLDKTKIEDFLRGGERSEIPFFVEEYIQNVGEAGKNSMIFRQYIVMDMYIAANHFLEELDGEEEIPRKEPFESPEQMEQILRELETTEVYIIQLFQEVMEVRDRHTKEHNSDMVELAKKYIQEHYNEDELSLNLVASKVNVSPNHLSAMFSQKTGNTFIRYLTDVRIGKARELLKCTNLRSSEVGEQVGYRDPHYFSHIFKKNQGCTPMQYREGGSSGEE